MCSQHFVSTISHSNYSAFDSWQKNKPVPPDATYIHNRATFSLQKKVHFEVDNLMQHTCTKAISNEVFRLLTNCCCKITHPSQQVQFRTSGVNFASEDGKFWKNSKFDIFICCELLPKLATFSNNPLPYNNLSVNWRYQGLLLNYASKCHFSPLCSIIHRNVANSTYMLPVYIYVTRMVLNNHQKNNK